MLLKESRDSSEPTDTPTDYSEAQNDFLVRKGNDIESDHSDPRVKLSRA